MRDPARRWIAAAAVLAVLLRLPFLSTGLSTDEGGYAYVARRWAQGAALYTDAWLDRPQGLLLVYRALLWPDDSGAAVRVGMLLAGAAVTVALGATGWLLVNRRTGVLAAWLYAVLGVAPHLEGMTLNGELLAAVPATVSVALAVAWWRGNRSPGWLAAAGLLAGVAVTMKQSGVDGLVVGLVVALGAGGARRWRAAAVFAAGAAVPLLASAVHGAVVGWSAYWTALVGYQFAALGGAGSNAGTRWTDLGRHAGDVALDLTLVTVVSLVGWRALDAGARRIAGAWLAAGFLGVNVGGSYWPHYFVQPLPVLVLLAAAAVAAVRAPRRRAVLAAVLVLPVLGWLAALVPMSPERREQVIPYAALAARDDRIAAVIRARTRPEDPIYVLESEAYLYLAARRVSPYPYLWGKPIDKIPEALPRLRALLASPQRPELVLLDTPPAAVDPDGGIAAALAAHYRLETVVEGVPLLRAVR
jgi:4-amino-4-deoxy-L-arabinose transferase-like glycosyltransferase